MVKYLLALTLLLVSCAHEDQNTSLVTADVSTGDVLAPMHSAIIEFQAALPRRADDFGSDPATSRAELIDRFVRAVQDSNVAALRALRLDIAEFGYLYFPPSRYTRPPYELPPGTLWLLIEQNGLKGESRLLQHYGGRSFHVTRHRCEAEPKLEGPNRLWEQCLLERRDDTGQLIEERLFGSIIERDGRFKFVSLANRL